MPQATEALHENHTSFDANQRITPDKDAPELWVAILEEQGSTGYQELAVAFQSAGFVAVQVTMQDLMDKRATLSRCVGLAFTSGTSFDDAPQPAFAWAQEILQNPMLHAIFRDFFARPDTFTLGIQNGAHVLTHLRDMIPGTEHWQSFVRNRCGHDLHQWLLAEITPSPSIFFEGMEGSRLPVIFSTAYGAYTGSPHDEHCLRHVDSEGFTPTSHQAKAIGHTTLGLCSHDGRVMAIQPVIERCTQGFQHTWHPNFYGQWSPWQRVFDNAYQWAIQQARLQEEAPT